MVRVVDPFPADANRAYATVRLRISSGIKHGPCRVEVGVAKRAIKSYWPLDSHQIQHQNPDDGS